MSDLGSVLRRTDMSAVAIQTSAAAIMVHYDRSPQVAVTEWRNALQNCQEHQLLPLLYVANEVLQNSKRNRGNKFLEAFSPILGQSLEYICRQTADPTMTEKVRRTAKIWGDRRVFSIRFINDLLQGLEPYRHGNFSPTQQPSPQAAELPKPLPPPIIVKETNDNSDGDDEEDMFAFESPSQHLDMDISNVHVVSSSSGSSNANKRKKRRNSSTSPTSGVVVESSVSQKKKRRKSILSTAGLMDLWNQTSSLQQLYDSSMAALSQITPQHVSTDGVDQLVGDELLDQFQLLKKNMASIVKQRRVLHSVASRRHELEQEAVAYIPWLRSAMKQDQDDLEFCISLKKQVSTIQVLHAKAKAKRQAQIQKEKEQKQQQEQALVEQQQQEERRKALEQAMTVQTEAKPGEVWNPATREYQKLDTEERWRD